MNGGKSMSKMSKLDSILKEAEEHAQALVSCINEIRELYSGANEVAPRKEVGYQELCRLSV